MKTTLYKNISKTKSFVLTVTLDKNCIIEKVKKQSIHLVQLKIYI